VGEVSNKVKGEKIPNQKLFIYANDILIPPPKG